MSLTRAVRHTIIQLTGRFFSTVFGVIALAVITRYLGQERFGWYTTVCTFLQFFGILADFGLTLITAQMIATREEEEEKIVSNILALRLIISVLFFGAAMVLIWFFPYPAIIKWGVLIFSFSLFAATLQNIFVGVFQKHLAMDKVAWGDVLGRGLVLAGFLLVVARGASFLSILATSVLANIAQLALLWFFSRKFLTVRWRFDRFWQKEILKRSWPVAISIAFNLIYLRADILILSLVRSQSEVGLYGAAYRVIDVLASIPTIFMGIMLPLLTAAWIGRQQESFRHSFQRAFDLLAILGLPILLGGWFLAEKLMRALAGAEFAASGGYLKILLLALLAIFFCALSAHAVLALNKQKIMIKWYLFDALLSLAGYFIFIPRYGAWGAAGVTVFSETFILIASFAVVSSTTRFFPRLEVFLKSLLAAGLMTFFLYFFNNQGFLILFLSAATVYFFALILLRGVTLTMVREVIKGK